MALFDVVGSAFLFLLGYLAGSGRLLPIIDKLVKLQKNSSSNAAAVNTMDKAKEKKPLLTRKQGIVFFAAVVVLFYIWQKVFF